MPTINTNFATSFNGGTITAPLVLDLSAASGNTVPLIVKASFNAQNVDFLSVINSDDGKEILAVNSGGAVVVGDVNGAGAVAGHLLVTSTIAGHPQVNVLNGAVTAASGLGNTGATAYISNDGYKALWAGTTSGSLPTTTFSTTVGKQVDANTDRVVVIPVTYNPTAGAAATCLFELSPDNSTYSAIGTPAEPAGVALDGTVKLHSFVVPAGWYARLTTTNATLGTATYY